jgi:hypothetical protein
VLTFVDAASELGGGGGLDERLADVPWLASLPA